MTKLEEQLLNAFESLSNEHERQHAESVAAGHALRQMFEVTSRENAELLRHVQDLSEEVQRLAQLVRASKWSGR